VPTMVLKGHQPVAVMPFLIMLDRVTCSGTSLFVFYEQSAQCLTLQ
jgi:hypothetical protein